MDNEIIIVRNYSLRDYYAEVRKNPTESLPSSRPDGSDSDSTSASATPSAKGSVISDLGHFGSSDHINRGGLSTTPGDDFDLSARSVSACSFSSLAEPDVYDPVPRHFQPERWPEHLRICCSYCSLAVGKPWPLCTGVDVLRGVTSYRVDGIYCSPCHLKRELIARSHEVSYLETFQATLSAVSHMVRKKVPDLPLGMDKRRLAKFCGIGGLRDTDYMFQNQMQWEEFLAAL